MARNTIFTVGGTVQAGDGIYLQRSADEELLSLCRQGKYAYVLTARQMGKSSLMVGTAERLAQEGVRTTIVDMTELGVQTDSEPWYLGLIMRISGQLQLQTNIISWWQEQTIISYAQRLVQFFQEIVAGETDERIVVFIDEIDNTLSLDFTDDFFVALRYLYNARSTDPQLQRLSFVLFGVATPSDLIRDPRRTPFNIGQQVNLSDFTAEEISPLAEGLPLESGTAQTVLQFVLGWTSGHPYLTQRLCAALAAQKDLQPTQAAVDAVVAQTFFGENSSQDSNLQFVRDMLTKRAPDPEAVLITYEEILLNRRPVQDNAQSVVKSHLKLSGVVKRQGDLLKIRNPIYEQVFDRRWIRDQEPVNWWKLLPSEVKVVAGIALALLLISVVLLIGLFSASRTARQQQQAAEAFANNLALEVDRRATAETSALLSQEEAMDQAEAAQENAQLAEANANLAATREAQASLERSRAEQQAQIASARLLAAQAVELSDTRLDLALLLAMQSKFLADSLNQDFEIGSDAALAEILNSNPRLSRYLHGHDKEIRSIALNPAGDILATSSHDATIILWETDTWEPIGAPLAAPDQVERVLFTPDGRALAAGIWDGSIIIWDVDSREELLNLAAHDDRVWDLAFSPDGSILYSSSKDGTIKAWAWAEGELVSGPAAAHADGVRSLALSPDGQTLASAGDDANIRLWQASALQPLGAPLTGHEEVVTSVAFSPDGLMLASGSYDGQVRLWDAVSRTAVGEPFVDHKDRVWTVSFAPDGRVVASGGRDNLIILHDVASGEVLGAPLKGHAASVRTVLFTADGRRLLSGGDDSTVIIWQLGDREPAQTFLGHNNEVRSAAFMPNGQQLISGDEDGALLRWDVSTGQALGEPVAAHNGRIWSTAASPDGQILASSGKDGLLQLWDAESGTSLGDPLFVHDDELLSLAFSPDGRLLATADKGGNIFLFDVNSGDQLGEPLTGHQDRVWALQFAADGQTLYSAGRDGLIYTWDVASGQAGAEPIAAKETAAESAAFSHDGRFAALSSDDGSIVLWDLDQGQLLHELTAAAGVSVDSLAFSPDSQMLATGDKNGDIMLWNVGAGEILETFNSAHSGTVRTLKFSPDGERLVSGGADGLLLLWSFQPVSDVERACRIANRNLSQEEWSRFMILNDAYQRTCPDLPAGN